MSVLHHALPLKGEGSSPQAASPSVQVQILGAPLAPPPLLHDSLSSKGSNLVVLEAARNHSRRITLRKMRQRVGEETAETRGSLGSGVET